MELRLADDAADDRAVGEPRCRGLQCCAERLRERIKGLLGQCRLNASAIHDTYWIIYWYIDIT